MKNKEIKERLESSFFLGYKKAEKEFQKKINEILNIFIDDSIYTGRIVKFEIRNRIKEEGEGK